MEILRQRLVANGTLITCHCIGVLKGATQLTHTLDVAGSTSESCS